MDEVIDAVQAANGQEQDVILLGDFNFPPTDYGWQLPDWRALFQPPLKTTIGDKSLYDNIWFDFAHTTEYADSSGIVRFDEDLYAGDVSLASLEVSDHRPIWAVFWTNSDDDPDEYSDNGRGDPTERVVTEDIKDIIKTVCGKLGLDPEAVLDELTGGQPNKSR